ncbi:uncharacterized protein [Clytia hemisphaerica]|uniref:Uncharacterized protein n=1 Tax=Clytia hemisphaerica TaxID=252671 RepID=A0A7M5XAT3_9CNID
MYSIAEENESDESMSDGVCIHTLLSTRRGERSYSIRVRRAQETHRLFLDTKRSVRNVRVFYSFEFVRVRCHTKTSSAIYLPGDYDELILLNRINNKRFSLKDEIRDRSAVWLAVMKKFQHEKRDFDVGDILKVTKPWLGRRVLNWFKKTSDRRIKYLDTCVYPRKKCLRIPVSDLQKYCKECECPTKKNYKALSEAIERETLPFLMTVPFDPFSRSVRRASKYAESKDESDTTYFEKVIIDGVERFNVFLTSMSDEEDRISAIVIPHELEFHAECNMISGVINDGCDLELSEIELLQIQQRLEPLLMRMDTVDDLTQIDLEAQNREYSRGESHVEHEVEMECLVKYKASFKSTYTSSPILQPVAKNNPYYNVVVGESGHPEPADRRFGLEKEGWESEEEGEDMLSFDEKGGFLITKGRTKNNNDYLTPLNEFAKDYTRFKSTIQKIQDEEMEHPETMVVGVKGYVQVNGDEDGKKQLVRSETNPKKKKLFNFFHRKKQGETSTSSPVLATNSKRGKQESARLDYYQPMFDIHQEKPPLPPKPASLSMSSTLSSLAKSPASTVSLGEGPSTSKAQSPRDKGRLVRQWTACKDDEEQVDNQTSSLLASFSNNELPDRYHFMSDDSVNSSPIPTARNTSKFAHAQKRALVHHQRTIMTDKRSSTAPLLGSFDELTPEESPVRLRNETRTLNPNKNNIPTSPNNSEKTEKKKPDVPRKPKWSNNNRSSMRPLLDSFDNGDGSDFPQSPKSNDSFENSISQARRSYGNRSSTHSAILDSRIHYFESKFFQ